MDTWWPLGKFTVSAMGGAPAKAIRVEAKPGGKIVEIGPTGTEYLWGTIRSYDPHDFVSMDFHIAPPGDETVDSRSLVEVRFTVLGDTRTRVTLTQRNWEAFGEKAAMLRDRGYVRCARPGRRPTNGPCLTRLVPTCTLESAKLGSFIDGGRAP